MNPKIQKSLPIILSITSVVGVVATGVLIAKETEKHIDELREAKSDKKRYIRILLKSYAPAIVVGSATIASVTAGTIIGKKTEASLSATCFMLDGALRRYKGKAKDVLGKKAEEIEKTIADDLIQNNESKNNYKDEDGYRRYYEEHVGEFLAKPEDFQAAITKMNERILTGECYCSLKLFLEDMHAKMCDSNIDKVSYDYGWTSEYLREVYLDEGFTCFVHANTETCADENGEIKYVKVTFDKEPIFGVSEAKLYGGYNAKEIERHNDEIDALAMAYVNEVEMNGK